jgi:hypothetical protein
LIILITFGEEYKLWNSSLCSCTYLTTKLKSTQTNQILADRTNELLYMLNNILTIQLQGPEHFLRSRQSLSFTPRQYPLGRGLDRLHAPSWCFGKQKYFLSLQGIEPRFFVLPACSSMLYRMRYSGSSLEIIIIIMRAEFPESVCPDWNLRDSSVKHKKKKIWDSSPN